MHLNDRYLLSDLFPVKKNYLYFNFASDGPLPSTAKNAVFQALEEKTQNGMVNISKQVAVYEDIRCELSKLFSSKKENFAFIKNTSEGVLLALLAMDIKEDENYITAADAFPTTVRMMESNCKGEMRKIKINSPIPLQDQLIKVIDKKTRAIVLDWVHYFTGKIIDIEAIIQLARERKIFTVIDGIQGAGALGIKLEQSGIDFFISGAHKWLLSLQGGGFIYVSPHVWNKIQRKSFGWLGYDWLDFSNFEIEPHLREGATVMEYGTRSYMAAESFRECLKLINSFGINNIENHNRKLKELFLQNLFSKGYDTITQDLSASIVPFKPAEKDMNSKNLLNRLEQNKVKASLRNGYIRVGFHLVNHSEEVANLLEYL